jgi:hypothetical protein
MADSFGLNQIVDGLKVELKGAYGITAPLKGACNVEFERMEGMIKKQISSCFPPQSETINADGTEFFLCNWDGNNFEGSYRREKYCGTLKIKRLNETDSSIAGKVQITLELPGEGDHSRVVDAINSRVYLCLPKRFS